MNTSEISAYMGSTQVQAIYLGSTLVWGGDGPWIPTDEPDEFEVLVYDSNHDSSSYTFSDGIIPDEEFRNAGIIAVLIGSGITHIGETEWAYTFSTGSLAYVSIGPDVEYIGGRAFEATILTEVTIPETVNQIDTNAFYNFDGSCTITFEGPCPSFSMSEAGDLGSGTHIIVPDAYLSDYCSAIGEYDLTIESNDGYDCSSCEGQGLCDDGEGNCIPCE